MDTLVFDSRRKLIDLQQPVFESLSREAKRRNVSLKRFIENALCEMARELDEEQANELSHHAMLVKLIGSAKPANGRIEDIQDDRLQYLLSK